MSWALHNCRECNVYMAYIRPVSVNTKVKLDIYKCFGKSGIQEVDFGLSLDRVHTVCMKNWVGIEGGKVRRNVPCVGMIVRM